MKIANILKIKTIYRYIIASFALKLLNTLAFSFFIFFFIDYLNNPGQKLLSMQRIGAFSRNIDPLFTFIFFAAASWFLINFHKTRELMISHTYGVSAFKIARIILYFTFFCGLFYLFVFHGAILSFFSAAGEAELNKLQKMPIYAAENDCNYNIVLFENLQYQEHISAFEASKINFFGFRDCGFHESQSISSAIIKHGGENGGMTLEGINALSPTSPNISISINYDFNVFYKYFLRRIDDTIYRTTLEIIQNIKDFNANGIPTRKIEFELYTRISHTLSFFYAILIAFVFFSNLPPRIALIKRVFASICTISFFYLLNLIATSYIKKSLVLPPSLIITPSIILVLLLLSAVILGRN